MRAIPSSLIRGGTSRGVFFLAADLPIEPDLRDQVLIRVMGGPDSLQVDGVGGGHPLTNKVAVISPAPDPDVDVDYLFLQVDPVQQTVSDGQTCGNLMAGVGLFAIAQLLVEVADPVTTVRVRLVNTGALCDLELLTPDGRIQHGGDTAIDGVPGTAAPIVCSYLGTAGSACGALLPTGSVCDEIDGLSVTCIDNGMPVVAVDAQSLGVDGYQQPAILNDNAALKQKIQSVRRHAGPLMNLGDVDAKSVPKVCLMSPALAGGLINTRTFIPHQCHETIGVLGAISAATACMLAGSAVASLATVPDGNPKIVSVEHPMGALQVKLSLTAAGEVQRAGVVRTARILFSGTIYA